MAVPVLIYLAVNAGQARRTAGASAMSTDTAFALGMLALVGPRFPDRLRAFMLTVVVVDDVVALVVIATVYTERVDAWPLAASPAASFAAVARCVARPASGAASSTPRSARRSGWRSCKSGIDPVLVGLAMGLLTYAYPAPRSDLERATDLFRLFREQPTPELARRRSVGLQAAISPNERLQQLYHPWTSYVIVPLFALANAGIALDGELPRRTPSRRRSRSGILIGYVARQAGRHRRRRAWLVTRLSRGRLRPAGGLGGGRRRRRDRRASASPSRS